ncbi:hypothetical protein K9N08_02555 [Candidatus Gracilibacteria bacterium]|nr:hypothetical protein [Candidatus Gracilibacteria bacterium]MCF7856415.1 hypothetical protein [Candidatus Gracilibacteria bacterium]MCF7896288.1 hypothetical protein [Candidatus Gracilibacteria bacterium]
MQEQFQTFDLGEEDYRDGVRLIARKNFSADYLDFFEEVIEVVREKARDVFARSNGISIFVSHKDAELNSQKLQENYNKALQEHQENIALGKLIFFEK